MYKKLLAFALAVCMIFEMAPMTAYASSLQMETVSENDTAESDVSGNDGEETPVETDGIPKALADLMREAGVTEKEIRQTCFDRGHYPVDTPIKNYDPNFIDGWIIEHWTTVVSYIKNNLR